MGPARLDRAVYFWFGWIIRRTPRVPREMPVRASYGPRTGIFKVFHILWDSYGARAWPARVPYGPLTDTQENRHNQSWQNPARASYLVVLRGPYGPHTGCLLYLNPYGARKLIMHVLKLYGPRTGRQNPNGAARGPCGHREWTYDFCSKQPGNSPYGARECDVTEALGIRHAQSPSYWQLSNMSVIFKKSEKITDVSFVTTTTGSARSVKQAS